MRTVIFSILLSLICTQVFGATVLPEKLNVRIQPDMASVIVGTLYKGTEITQNELDSGWSMVPLPPKAHVWIHKSFLNADKQYLPNAVFREGPGVAHAAYQGKPVLNAKAEILETAKNGQWLRVKPPKGLCGYVFSSYLSTGSKNRKSSPKHPPLFIEGVNQISVFEGLLKPLKKNEKVCNAEFKLVLEVNNKSFMICYVIPGKDNLNMWEGRLVRIEGVKYWAASVKHPFIQAEKISPSWE